MINRLLKSVFTFFLVWVVYRAPDLFFEGYHDRAVLGYAATTDSKYLIDFISPVFVVPELVALFLAIFVWTRTSEKEDLIQSNHYLFGSLYLFGMLMVASKVYVL